MEVSPTPINLVSDGSWQESKTNLTPDSSTGGLSVQQNVLHPKLKDDASANGVLSVEQNGYTVSYTLQGADNSSLEGPSPAQVRSGYHTDQATYSDVFKGVDLQYEVQPSAVKETLKLDTVPPASTSSFVWKVSAPGLSLVKNADGGVDLNDVNGTTRFRVPTPLMWDSSGVTGSSSDATTNVPLAVDRTGSDWTITLAPSRDWLTDAERVYPVFVDPTTWSGGPQDIHSYKADGTLRTDTILVGNARDPGDDYWRSIVHFPYEQLFGKQVLDASISVAWTGDYGTSNSYPGAVDYATAFGYSGVGQNLASLTVGSTGASSGAGLAKQISSWVKASSSGNYLMLAGGEIPGAYSLKSLNAALYVSYKNYPTVTPATPASGARVATAPTLTVTGTDPEKTGLTYLYRVSTNANPDTSPVWDSGWGLPNTATVPDARLAPNTKYYWKAYVHDGYYFNSPADSSSEAHSAVWSFTTNTPGTTTAAQATPADNTVIVTPTPTFSTTPGTDANGDPLKYQFRVTTGTDASSGVVATSDLITPDATHPNPTWTMPAGILQDGVTYSWTILVDDGYDIKAQNWTKHFRYTTRLGAPGPSPSDSAGGGHGGSCER